MQKICPHCGAFMPTEAVFCLHCFSAVDISEKTASPRGGATPRKKPAVRRVQHRIGERCTAGILLVTLLTSMFFSFAGGHFSPASALHTFTRGDGLFTATHRSEQTETSETEPDSLAAEETASVFQRSGKRRAVSAHRKTRSAICFRRHRWTLCRRKIPTTAAKRPIAG